LTSISTFTAKANWRGAGSLSPRYLLKIISTFRIKGLFFSSELVHSVFVETETNGSGKMVITWNTKKTAYGYDFIISRIGYQSYEVIKTGTCPTRAKAVLLGKKWSRYLKAKQNEARPK
jgi:hypothetical protein